MLAGRDFSETGRNAGCVCDIMMSHENDVIMSAMLLRILWFGAKLYGQIILKLLSFAQTTEHFFVAC